MNEASEGQLGVGDVVRRRRTYGGGAYQSTRRPKVPSHNRRISCLDLGSGDHEGWLFTMKSGKRNTWDKCRKWCVLKSTDLYVFNSKMDSQASTRISLPMFKISDAKKETKKKTAFKVYHSGTTFFFRTDQEDEKYQWINLLSLASINYPLNDYNNLTSAGSSGNQSSDSQHTYSDEEEETDSDYSAVPTLRRSKRSTAASNPSKIQSHIESNAELHDLVSSILDADLDLVGEHQDIKRKTSMRKSMAKYSGVQSNESKTKLFLQTAKKNQLELLQKELYDINSLLENLSAARLKIFLGKYPDFSEFPSSRSDSDLSLLECPSPRSLNRSANNSNRNTIIFTEEDLIDLPTRVSDVTLLDESSASPPIRRSASPNVFQSGRHKQAVTHL